MGGGDACVAREHAMNAARNGDFYWIFPVRYAMIGLKLRKGFHMYETDIPGAVTAQRILLSHRSAAASGGCAALSTDRPEPGGV